MIRLPDNAPFDPNDRAAVEGMLGRLAGSQRDWLSGYLAGLSAAAGVATGSLPSASGGPAVTVLYGTESGNAEALADLTAKEAKRRGFRARVRNMAETKVEELKEAENLLVIVSTWGEGDPPETAIEFHRGLMNGSPTLEAVRFSVCALGDTSYDQFCQIGKDVDQRLEELGAKRIADRADCDVDFDEPHAEWMTKVFAALGEADAGVAAAGTAAVSVPTVQVYGKKKPFPAEVLDKVLLNGEGTAKETWHLELSLEGSGLAYEPGDSLAVVPRNSPDVVEALLRAAGLSGSEEVTLKDGSVQPAAEAFASGYDITALSRNVAKKFQALADSKKLAALLDGDAFRDYADGRQIVDLLEDFPVKGLKAQDLAGLLRGLPPRLYSIASSPKAHPGEVHLTVAAVRYQTHGRERKGVASTWIADLVKSSDQVDVFVQPNKRFRLPADDGTPIIMVGPGTGVAPFRAFVEERAARNATGDSWLFFGDQRYLYDFLYQLDWQDHLKSGALRRLDVAFSRDQPEKVYVQHRLAERAREVFAWLEKGGHFYVCGDATRMAGDVHEALLHIVAAEGGKSPEEAAAYLEQLKTDGRYQRDVY